MAIKKTTEEAKLELLDKHGLTLTQEYTGAHRIITFLCKNGHENSATATNVFRRGYVCKQCKTGRTIIPKITWNTEELEKLVTLVDQMESTENIAINFNTTIQAINNACAKFNIERPKERYTSLKVAEVLKAQNRTTIDSISTHKSINITCNKGHTVNQSVSNVLYKNTGCPDCFSTTGISLAEKTLREFIEQEYQGWIVYNDRSILEGKELDIVLPDKSLAFEFNGTYWHQDKKVPINYHKDKTDIAEANDYQLIHIQDYLWTTKQDIVKSRVKQLLHSSIKIPARKTEIKQIQFPREFLEANHLQGAGSPTSTNYALYYNDEIVAVMTFGKPRFTSNQEWELVRYATKCGTTVQGGASKLFKHFIKQTNPKSVVSYASRDFSKGSMYYTLGFKHQHNSEPGYSYYKHLKRVSRYQAQKHKLEALLPLYDPKLQEQENMTLNGYYKVYDSGNMVFTWAP